ERVNAPLDAAPSRSAAPAPELPASKLPAPPELPATVAGVDTAMRRMITLVRGIPDLSPLAVGSWSMEQTVLHLVSGLDLYIGIARGQGSPYSDLGAIAASNEALMATVTERG